MTIFSFVEIEIKIVGEQETIGGELKNDAKICYSYPLFYFQYSSHLKQSWDWAKILLRQSGSVKLMWEQIIRKYLKAQILQRDL